MKTTVKHVLSCLALLAVCGCGSSTTTHETVVHDRPIVVQPPVATSSPDSVEETCAHGYDNSTHHCY